MAQISVDSLLGNNGPSYPEQIAAPFRKELTDNGSVAGEISLDISDVLKTIVPNVFANQLRSQVLFG